MVNILLSYPRSGNHFVRFLIEYLSGSPTHGCISNPEDTYICRKKFHDYSLLAHVNQDKAPIIYKYHYPRHIYIDFPHEKLAKLILIVRNYKEALPSHTGRLDASQLDRYMTLICFYKNFSGPKRLIYYEDLLKKPHSIIDQVYNFLELNKLGDPKHYARLLVNLNEIIQKSKQCYTSIQAYQNKSGDDPKYYSKQIDILDRLTMDRYLEDRYPNLVSFVSRYFD